MSRPYRPNPFTPEGKRHIAMQERIAKLTEQNARLKETTAQLRKEIAVLQNVLSSKASGR